MEIFKRRPLALICFISVCLSIISVSTNRTVSLIMITTIACSALTAGALLIWAFFKKIKKKTKEKLCFVFIASLVVLAVLGSCYLSFSKDVYYTKDIGNRTLNVCGRIDEINYRYPYAESYYITVFSVDGHEYEFKALLETEASTNLRDGSIFCLIGESEMLITQESMFSIADGICLRIIVSTENIEHVKIIGREDKNTLAKIFDDINHDAQQALIANTDKETAALTGAMLLGNRENLGDKLLRDFRRCGISHMLALSGLHMSIIMGLIDHLLKILYVRKKLRSILMAFLALVYLSITGFSPSACRSVIMLCFVYLAYMLNCDADSITSLFMGLVIIFIFSPYAMADVGLWMSFVATLGIILSSELTSKMKFHIKKKKFYQRVLILIAVSFIITISSTIAISVFLWLFFGEISLISPLTNIIFTPLMSLVILFGLMSIALGGIPLLSEFISFVLKNTCLAIEDVSSFFSQLRSITVSLKYDFVPYIIIPAILTVITMMIIKLKRKWLIAIPPIVAIVAFAVSLNVYNVQHYDQGKIHYLKNQRSEMIIVQNADGISICDVSTGGYSHLYNACQVAFSECFVEIENIVLTHYHSYHANAIVRICDKYMVRNIFLPAPTNEKELTELSEISDRLVDRNVNTILYQREEGISAGSGYFIYVSDTEYIKRSVHPIFALSVRSPSECFTYCTSAIGDTASICDRLSHSDTVIFGSHGPTVKEFASLEFFEKFANRTSTIIFSDCGNMIRSNELIEYLEALSKDNRQIITENISHCEFNISN